MNVGENSPARWSLSRSRQVACTTRSSVRYLWYSYSDSVSALLPLSSLLVLRSNEMLAVTSVAESRCSPNVCSWLFEAVVVVVVMLLVVVVVVVVTLLTLQAACLMPASQPASQPDVSHAQQFRVQ